MIENNELKEEIQVDSAGTAAFHIGESPDPRSIQAAAKRGYRLQHYRARQVVAEDYQNFDYILAMDTANFNELNRRKPDICRASVELLLAYSASDEESVPDPYYSGESGFELVLDLLEEACGGLLERVQAGQEGI